MNDQEEEKEGEDKYARPQLAHTIAVMLEVIF
jgi:hypothetical protein